MLHVSVNHDMNFIFSTWKQCTKTKYSVAVKLKKESEFTQKKKDDNDDDDHSKEMNLNWSFYTFFFSSKTKIKIKKSHLCFITLRIPSELHYIAHVVLLSGFVCKHIYTKNWSSFRIARSLEADARVM